MTGIDFPIPPRPAGLRPRSVARGHPGIARALRAVLRPLYATLLQLDVEGEENIPVEGPCLLVFNHLSNLDPHLLFTRVARSDATGLVTSDYRGRPLHRWIVESAGGRWLRRGAGDRAALLDALHLLGEGWLVGLAPEGGRSPSGVMREGRPGAAFLALRSGAPVVPTGVDGTDRAMHALLRGRRPRVAVRFGPPFYPRPPARLQARRDRLDHATAEIMTAIAQLVPAERRGPWRGEAEP